MSKQTLSFEEIFQINDAVYADLNKSISDEETRKLMQSLYFSNSSIKAVQCLYSENDQNNKKKRKEWRKDLKDDFHDDVYSQSNTDKMKQYVQKELNKLTEDRIKAIGNNFINMVEAFQKKTEDEINQNNNTNEQSNETKVEENQQDISVMELISKIIVENGVLNDDNSFKRKETHKNYQKLLVYLKEKDVKFKNEIYHKAIQLFDDLLKQKDNYVIHKFDSLGCMIGNLFCAGYLTRKHYFNLLKKFIDDFKEKKDFACSAILSSLFISGEYIDNNNIYESNYFYRFLVNSRSQLPSYLQFRTSDLLEERNRDINSVNIKEDKLSQFQQKPKEKRKLNIDVGIAIDEFEKYLANYGKRQQIKFEFNNNISDFWYVMNSMLIKCQEDDIQIWVELCNLFLVQYKTELNPNGKSIFFDDLFEFYNDEYSPLNLAKILFVLIYYSIRNENNIDFYKSIITVINNVINNQKLDNVKQWKTTIERFLKSEIYWSDNFSEEKLNIFVKEIFTNLINVCPSLSKQLLSKLLQWFIFINNFDDPNITIEYYSKKAIEESSYFYLACYLYLCIPEDEESPLSIDETDNIFTSGLNIFGDYFIPIIETMFEGYPEDVENIKAMLQK